MKNQLILFEGNGEAHARGEDPETSKEAAAAMRGREAAKAEQIVLDALLRLGGAGTAYEIEVEVQRIHPGMHAHTITPRMKPLERKNLVERTDKRGRGRGTRMQIVWRAV